MPMWSDVKKYNLREELRELYILQNLTVGEIAKKLGLGTTTVYERIKHLGLPILREKKAGYNNKNKLIKIPINYGNDLAEFVGILLGDGHLTPTQVTVTLGTKEDSYVEYVKNLMHSIFGVRPKSYRTKRSDCVVYLGSKALVEWFLKMGLVFNKVREQVDIPGWCLEKKEMQSRVLRGLVDTDGSIYELKNGGAQISFCNCSKKLLESARQIMINLGFNPSKTTANKVYLTRQADLIKYNHEIGFGNKKHRERFNYFVKV